MANLSSGKGNAAGERTTSAAGKENAS